MFLQPWVLKAKNAMTLEDLKQLLIEVGNGLQVFKDQIKWQNRVDSITSFSLVSILYINSRWPFGSFKISVHIFRLRRGKMEVFKPERNQNTIFYLHVDMIINKMPVFCFFISSAACLCEQLSQ